MVDVGSIVEVGRLRGDFVGADPAGRYIAVLREKVLIVHDVHDGLTSVSSWRVDHQILDPVAVSPRGDAAVALTGDDWHLELWRAGNETPIRVPTDIAGSQAALNFRHGFGVPGWLRYSADGSYLYFGESVRTEQARLNLLDPTTLARLDATSPVCTHVGGEPIEEWGEDLEAHCSPAPSTAIAFAANAGDDMVVLGVAEAVAGGLRVHSGRSAESWADIPGERGMAIAALAADELVVLDSDEFITRIRWKERPMVVTEFASGRDLLSFDAAARDEAAETLRSFVRDDEDERLMLTGPMAVSGRLLAVAVDREKWAPGSGLHVRTVALVVVDIGTGERRAVLRVPEAEYTCLSGRTICQRIGPYMHISRWVAPETRVRTGTDPAPD